MARRGVPGGGVSPVRDRSESVAVERKHRVHAVRRRKGGFLPGADLTSTGVSTARELAQNSATSRYQMSMLQVRRIAGPVRDRPHLGVLLAVIGVVRITTSR